MKIEKIEKVTLTAEEANVLKRALNIVDEIYNASSSKGELENQTSNIITVLTDFLDEVNIYLEK